MLSNVWLGARVTSASFVMANEQFLMKSPSSATALVHWTIALLNTEHKIFTRIFALRLGLRIPVLIHGYQAGFVHGCSIHTTINNILSAQAATATVLGQKGVASFQVNFQKASDVLSRAFLHEILVRGGFPKALWRWWR